MANLEDMSGAERAAIFLLGVGELISRCSMKTQEVKNELKKNMNG